MTSQLTPQTTVKIGQVEPGRPLRPTRKPGVNRFRPPVRPTDPPKTFKTSHRPRVPYKPTPPPEPSGENVYRGGIGGGGTHRKTTKLMLPKTTTRPSILDLDQCKPACNAANKEVCKEFDGKYKCDCRAGYVKKSNGDDTCYGLLTLSCLHKLTERWRMPFVCSIHRTSKLHCFGARYENW